MILIHGNSDGENCQWKLQTRISKIGISITGLTETESNHSLPFHILSINLALNNSFIEEII